MKKTIFMLFLLSVPFLSRAQGVPVEGKGSMIGIKSNIPYWATATFNLGAEVYLARHWTLELEAGLNPFSGKNDDGSYWPLTEAFASAPGVEVLVLRDV